jgi:MarR family 2-MHQ and catechol resistance regulon transcriptional repressor
VKNDLKTLTILFRATHRFETLIKQDVQQYGLNATEFGVLEVLYHKGPLSIQVIKDKILIASSSMSYVVEQLMDKALILRQQNQQDKRFSVLELSPQGQSLMNEVYPLHAQSLRHILNKLSADEEKSLQDLLKRIGIE